MFVNEVAPFDILSGVQCIPSINLLLQRGLETDTSFYELCKYEFQSLWFTYPHIDCNLLCTIRTPVTNFNSNFIANEIYRSAIRSNSCRFQV